MSMMRSKSGDGIFFRELKISKGGECLDASFGRQDKRPRMAAFGRLEGRNQTAGGEGFGKLETPPRGSGRNIGRASVGHAGAENQENVATIASVANERVTVESGAPELAVGEVSGAGAVVQGELGTKGS